MSNSLLPYQSCPSPPKVTIGNSEIGSLELVRLNSLSVLESEFVRENTTDLPNLQKEAVSIARSIVEADPELKLIEVFNSLISGNKEALILHLDRVVEFDALCDRVSQVKSIVQATAILKYRCQVAEWTIEDTRDPNKLHPGLLAEIVAFAWKERNGWQDPEPVTTEAQLGELKPSRTRRSRTGQKSSGSLTTTTQTTNGSAPIVLDGNPSG